MITIGSGTRALPAGADITATPIEPMTLDAMFAAIVQGVTVAAATEVAGEGTATDVAVDQPDTPVCNADAAASVVQLLALTVKQQAKALKEGDADEPQPEAEAEAEGQLPDGAESGIVPPAAPAVAQVTVAAPQATALAAQPPVELTLAKEAKPLKATVIIEGEKVEKPETKSPVALAVAEIMQATRQLGLPQGRRAVPDPTLRRDDPAPVSFGQEVKQVVHQAISSMQAQPAPLPFDIARPIETVLEPLMAEPQIDPSEFAIERQLDVSAEGEWLDSLARDIARTAGEGGTLRFKLNPENLGTLRVEITPHANGSAVRLTADTDAARSIIADAQPRLVAEARANGVRIAETHVDLGGQNSSGDPRRQNAEFEEAPVRTARFLRDREESDGKPTRNQSERYA